MIPDRDDPPVPPWSRTRRDLAAIIWPSFLVASVATMLLFAFVDPAAVGDRLPHQLLTSRLSAYSAGFFFLWLTCIASAALSLYLVRTAREDRAPPSR